MHHYCLCIFAQHEHYVIKTCTDFTDVNKEKVLILECQRNQTSVAVRMVIARLKGFIPELVQLQLVSDSSSSPLH